MKMKQVIAATAMMALAADEMARELKPADRPYIYPKGEMTRKQIKTRAKAKAARKARKHNKR